MKVAIETPLWEALADEDKVSRSGVRYTPSVELESDEETPTGFMVMMHPDIDEIDDLMLKIQKIRHADKVRA